MRFNEQEKSSGEWDSNFYHDKLKRGLEQVHAGLGIIKTMEELEAMEKMKAKVLQISYEPERDRLTWDGWDLHCGQSMEVLLPDQLGGGTWRSVSFEYNDDGWVHARIFWCVSDWLVGDGDERVKKRRGVDLVVFYFKDNVLQYPDFQGRFRGYG